MAVSVQTPLYSKTIMWNTGEPPSAFSASGSDPEAASMTYQYPLVSPGMDSSSNMIPSLHHLARDRTQASSPTIKKGSSPKNRPISVPSKSAKIKRSMSTPNVRGQATADAAALALSAEKRRNKLGYHRTSVACGHCRRRKIRCIPAPSDPQNRCSNCIRLKKDCNFYPVDQQPQPEPKRRDSRAQSGTGMASESSSPSTSSGQLPDVPPNLPFPHPSMPPIQDIGGPQMKRQRTESFSPENRGATSRSYDYSHGNTNWMAPDASPSTKPPDLPQSFWRVNNQDSPLTPAFSPFTPSLPIPPPQSWPATHSEASPRDEMSWPAPQRSISYSNLEGLNNHHHYGSFPHPQNPQPHPSPDHYTSKPRAMHSSMYPPPISTSNSGHPATEVTSAATSDPPQHSYSAGSLPPAHYPHWQQPYPYQKPVGPSSEPYSPWGNPHSAPHHGLSEEGHATPTGYGYGDPASGGGFYPPPHSGR